MTTFGVSMFKDEADIAGHTLDQMLSQVDWVIVADNGSTDGTRELVERDRVTVIDDPELGYYQSRKVTALARIAAEQGASWVVPFDADEFWYSPHGRIADVLATVHEPVVPVPMYNHFVTAADPSEGTPFERMGWRQRDTGALMKVACRTGLPVTIAQGNHSCSYPPYAEAGDDLLVVRHFPYRSAEQMIRKARNGAAAYAATDLPENEGEHWRAYDRLSDEQIEETFRLWFWSEAPEENETLIYDPAPSNRTC